MNVGQALRELPPESRLTGGAAAALIFSMVLPWYQVNSLGKDESRSAFAVFTWVEAAILLVAAAVLYLVWARAQRRRFHLPGGDGFVVSLAGGWVLALLIWRLFDKPKIGGATTTVGIDWGIFVALLAAGALVAAGARVRAAGRPEPANPIAEETEWEVPERTAARARRQRPPARAHRGHAGPARAPAGVGGRRARAAGAGGAAAAAGRRSWSGSLRAGRAAVRPALLTHLGHRSSRFGSNSAARRPSQPVCASRAARLAVVVVPPASTAGRPGGDSDRLTLVGRRGGRAGGHVREPIRG